MSKEALVEEGILLGLDERAATAIADENDGIHNTATVVARAEDAQDQANAA